MSKPACKLVDVRVGVMEDGVTVFASVTHGDTTEFMEAHISSLGNLLKDLSGIVSELLVPMEYVI